MWDWSGSEIFIRPASSSMGIVFGFIGFEFILIVNEVKPNRYAKFRGWGGSIVSSLKACWLFSLIQLRYPKISQMLVSFLEKFDQFEKTFENSTTWLELAISTFFNSSKSSSFSRKSTLYKMLAQVCRVDEGTTYSIYKLMAILLDWIIRKAFLCVNELSPTDLTLPGILWPLF